MNHELAKTLTTAIVQFIDRERTEGIMCCSNEECVKLEKAFEANNFDFVEGFMEKKLSKLTEFEKCMLDFAKARDEYEFDSTKITELNNKVIELTKSYSKKLLALAKKELISHADESDPKNEAIKDLERIYFCNPEKLPRWLRDDIVTKELNAHIRGYNEGYKDASEEYERCKSYHLWQEA